MKLPLNYLYMTDNEDAMVLSGGFSGDGDATFTITIDDVSGAVVAYSLINQMQQDVAMSMKKDATVNVDTEVKVTDLTKSVVVSVPKKDQIATQTVEMTKADGTKITRPNLVYRVGSPTLNKL